jgi:hypothetical protein
MDTQIKAEFTALADQIRKGFSANDRQFRVLKTRMAKLELELQGVQKASNRNAIEISGMKGQSA